MTALTDRDDRARLTALALVGLGLLAAIAFIWVRLVAGSSPRGERAAVANHAAAVPAPAAVAESAAAGVLVRAASAPKSVQRFSGQADAQAAVRR